MALLCHSCGSFIEIPRDGMEFEDYIRMVSLLAKSYSLSDIFGTEWLAFSMRIIPGPKEQL